MAEPGTSPDQLRVQVQDQVRALAERGAARPLEPRAPRESGVTLSQFMELSSANIQGNVHGGEIMRLIDTAAGIAAARHAHGPAVTVALDEMVFLHPVSVGNVVVVKASVNDAGRTSMEVGVRVEAEDLTTGRVTHTSSAYLVFVALDAELRPRPVPPVEPETDEERRRQAEARIRRESRLARAEAIRRQRGG
jgi:acyl-CoA hydrolase